MASATAERQRAEIRALVAELDGRRESRSSSSISRSTPVEVSVSRSRDGRTVEAYAAIFDEPYAISDIHGAYHEVIAPDAFNAALRSGSRPLYLWNHGMSLSGTPDALASVPLGSPVEIKPDKRGLWTVSRLNHSPLAESVLESIKAGDVQSYSFRGPIRRSTPQRVPRRVPGTPLPTVVRHELGISDYGPTATPCNTAAKITAVRRRLSAYEQERLHERWEVQRAEIREFARRHDPAEQRRWLVLDQKLETLGGLYERGIVDRSRLPKHADPGYQADRRERYPLDTPEHAAASWEALDDDENAAFYTPQQLILVRERIQVAMRRYGA